MSRDTASRKIRSCATNRLLRVVRWQAVSAERTLAQKRGEAEEGEESEEDDDYTPDEDEEEDGGEVEDEDEDEEDEGEEDGDDEEADDDAEVRWCCGGVVFWVDASAGQDPRKSPLFRAWLWSCWVTAGTASKRRDISTLHITRAIF